MRRYLGAFFLTAALTVPLVVRADDDHPRRYYDRDRKDYHEWNEREDRAYRHYLEGQRREYREWNKLNRREQGEYWRWRHVHNNEDWERRDKR